MRPLRQKNRIRNLEGSHSWIDRGSLISPQKQVQRELSPITWRNLGPAFYDKYEEGQRIPFADAKPELVEAYDQFHIDLTNAYESEGVTGT